MALTAWQEQQKYSAQRDALVAQGARVGRSTHKVFTKGRGDLRIAQPVNFSLTFVEEPVFTAGVTLKSGQALIEHLYPLVSVGVYQWKKDSRGMYVGAYLWASVAAGVNQEFAGYASRLGNLVDEVRGASALTLKIDEAKAEIDQLRRGTIQYTQELYTLYQAQAEAKANAYQLEHHLIFEALAIRDINYDQMMAD